MGDAGLRIGEGGEGWEGREGRGGGKSVSAGDEENRRVNEGETEGLFRRCFSASSRPLRMSCYRIVS